MPKIKKKDQHYKLAEKRKEKRESCVEKNRLGLNFVLSSEHVVNLGEVVCARGNGVGAARRLEVLGQVGVLTQLAHL